MVNLGALWKQKTKDGQMYLSGKLGEAKLLVFVNDKKGNEKAPDFRVCVDTPKKPDAKPQAQQASDDFADF